MSKRKKKYVGQYIIVSIFFIFIFSSIVWGSVRQVLNIRQYKAQINDLNINIKSLDKEINNIKKDKDNINEDEYIEKIARERLNMVKPGEILYMGLK